MIRLLIGGAALLGAMTPVAAAESATVTVIASSPPNLFGTVALPTKGGLYAQRWAKIVSDNQVPPLLAAMIRSASGKPRLQQLATVQAEVDRRIGWRSDGTAYGERDYWATAGETLAAGFGDDEDRAILKFQMLRALGWRAQDLFLVLGRDHSRGSHTLLAARAEGRFWLLEERGDKLVPADQRTGFTPMVSFGDNRTWLHGKLRAAASGSPTTGRAGAVAAR